MPPRGRDGLYSQAERQLRDARLITADGVEFNLPNMEHFITIEPPEVAKQNDIAIASAGAQEATFSLEGVELNVMQDVIEEYAAERRREAERQTLAAAFNRISAESRDAIDGLSDTAQLFARAYGVSFIDSLNSAWAAMGDDFELADEEEYVATDPISFDELMGGCCGDN